MWNTNNTGYKFYEKCECYEKVLDIEWNEYQDIFRFWVNKMFEDVI